MQNYSHFPDCNTHTLTFSLYNEYYFIYLRWKQGKILEPNTHVLLLKQIQINLYVQYNTDGTYTVKRSIIFFVNCFLHFYFVYTCNFTLLLNIFRGRIFWYRGFRSRFWFGRRR